MQVAGLLAPPPSHGILAAVVAEQPAGQLLATGLDAPALREQLQQPALAPRVLRLDPASPLGYARDLDVLPNTLPPERHRGYAAQWFALAVALFFLVLWRQLRKKTRSEEHTSELQSLMRISYAVFCLKQTRQRKTKQTKHLTPYA